MIPMICINLFHRMFLRAQSSENKNIYIKDSLYKAVNLK